MFGRRNPPAPASPAASVSRGGTGGDNPSSGERPLPWHDDPSDIACNLAAGNLANNLSSWLVRDGRVHAETYVAAAGVIAGYCAQHALLARHDPEMPPGLQVVTTAAGDEYLFGDPLNEMLLAESEADAAGKVWARAAGAAVQLGVPFSRLPDYEQMFAHVASTLGGPQEGLPSTGPDHQPAIPARQLLAALWPHALLMLSGDIDDTHRRFGPVPRIWWGAVAALGASRPILDVKDVLAPPIALTILMESAIYGSKLTRL